MKYLSVCSGIEAASVAWEPFGWVPVGFSEIEPFPCSVLAERFPAVPNLGDMTKFKEWKIACNCDSGHDNKPRGEIGSTGSGLFGRNNVHFDKNGSARRGDSGGMYCDKCGKRSIDLLVGGTPCQAFSVAGLRQGLADPRGNLMLTFGAIAGHFKPTWLVWENVPGVLSSNRGRDFGSFLGMLGELGYGFAYRVLDAQYFGVAQRRRRVFVVGYLGDWRRAAQVLFESESLFGDSPPSRETGKSSSRGATFGIDEECNATEDGFGPLLRGGQGGTRQAVAYGVEVHDGRGRGEGDLVPTLCSDHIGRPSDFSPLVSMALNAKGGSGRMDGESETMVPIAFSSKDYGADADEISPTLRAMGHSESHQNGGGQVGISSPSGVRRLTPRECERLQGFSDDWTAVTHRGKPAADGPRYKALGNSMAVPVMRWIGERIEREEAQKND